MTTVEEIKRAISHLSDAELAELRTWYEQFAAAREDAQVKADGPVDLASRGIDPAQAADLRTRLQTFAEDWERTEMDAYDDYERDYSHT